MFSTYFSSMVMGKARIRILPSFLGTPPPPGFIILARLMTDALASLPGISRGEGRARKFNFSYLTRKPNSICFFRCLLSESGLVEGRKRKRERQAEQLLHSTGRSLARSLLLLVRGGQMRDRNRPNHSKVATWGQIGSITVLLFLVYCFSSRSGFVLWFPGPRIPYF